ncbi:MSHA biogenesis protein MshE [Marinobacter persicus]|uniref:MSHA biogenesis protein MshE n=1 Tax=Marinobacter persicus TaxID=930118 RepID=A0A1I3XBI7_9GAMM|nr:GspE/PulE family protein [Marinobacter persicus]GHD49002.1 MSHA biogenesis protein MshE [Marinobacter persicus]SFK16922.1 MSHA biogenesis protein MshE [Marinobacter persicus]
MSTEPKKKIRIGDLLVQNDVITESQLKTALREQKSTGRKLGRTLVELGYVEEDTLLNILSRQLNVPFVQLRHYQFNSELVKKLPEAMARRFRAIVLAQQGEELLVGMADPLDLVAYDELVRVLKQPVKQAVVRESELLGTLDLVYRRTDEIASLAEELEDELDDDAFDLASLSAESESADAPVVKLLQTLFEDAVQARSSDIHIEPDETVVRIRQRIDGVLQEQVMKEKRVNSALVLRLKLMAGLNISEKRLPQDGRFNIRVKGRSIDVRVSTMPVQHGESVVMRLLDQSQGTLDLEGTGMPRQLLERFRKLIKRPHGMILVTGPTGSGKTTTLYGALTELNKPEVKIITAEDPVEYRLPRITQVQVNPKIGLEFAGVLRSALRQDPDIILVGEMRDHETVEIGLRAAMTGHLVLSTLHTNDSISSAMRLIDMGAEPFLVASSLLGVVAQRLVRRVCDNCKETYEPTDQELIWLRSFDLDPLDIEAGFVHGRGCYQCSNTGYKGRVGVYEMLEMNEDMLDALRRKDVSDFTRSARKSDLFRPLGQCAMDYALQGVTSLQEVARVAATAETGLSLEEEQTSDAIGVDS